MFICLFMYLEKKERQQSFMSQEIVFPFLNLVESEVAQSLTLGIKV